MTEGYFLQTDKDPVVGYNQGYVGKRTGHQGVAKDGSPPGGCQTFFKNNPLLGCLLPLGLPDGGN